MATGWWHPRNAVLSLWFEVVGYRLSQNHMSLYRTNLIIYYTIDIMYAFINKYVYIHIYIYLFIIYIYIYMYILCQCVEYVLHVTCSFFAGTSLGWSASRRLCARSSHRGWDSSDAPPVTESPRGDRSGPGWRTVHLHG